MTDDQFKQLMEKLDKIEKEIKAGEWKFTQPHPMPHYYPAWPSPHFGPHSPMPIITD